MGTLKSGDVAAYPADQDDVDSYARVSASQVAMPVLLHVLDQHERLYVAALDGTGNSRFKDAPENWSIVARIDVQIHGLNRQGQARIASGYMEGIGTQRNPVSRMIDSINGYSFDERVETAYYDYCVQAKKWIDEDPSAKISIAGIGFSRGAEEVAALHRMIHTRGIRDPEGADVQRNRDNLITNITYADRPLLRDPGMTRQVALLYDPVSTGVQEHDRRLPPSVIGAVQLTAEDEKRDQFPSTTHIAPGCDADGHFCNLIVGGSHSDVGGTYPRNGLGVRSFNVAVDKLNELSDVPFLRKEPVPDDPGVNVVHRSERHMLGMYTTFGFRDGVRNQHSRLGGKECARQVVEPCDVRQPADPELSRGIEFRRSGEASPDVPSATANAPSPFFPRTSTDAFLEKYHDALRRGDSRGRAIAVEGHRLEPHIRQMEDDAAAVYQEEQARLTDALPLLDLSAQMQVDQAALAAAAEGPAL